jgi:quercetin dioxygenase-like cupin family protein
MKIDKAQNVGLAEITEEVKGVTMRILISDKDGAPNSVMRLFEIEPGGYTPLHTHAWEHEVFVLEGEGVVVEGEKEHALTKDSFAYVAPGERHQFLNRGSSPFKFICVVPVK